MENRRNKKIHKHIWEDKIDQGLLKTKNGSIWK